MSLYLVHVHLPDGTVTEPMPMGRVLDMLEAKQITLDTQICDRGSTAWRLLRYEPAVMRPVTQTPPTPSKYISTSVSMDEPEETLADKLYRAALIFAALGVLCGIAGAMAMGPTGFIWGFSGPVGLAVVVAVFSYVLQSR